MLLCVTHFHLKLFSSVGFAIACSNHNADYCTSGNSTHTLHRNADGHKIPRPPSATHHSMRKIKIRTPTLGMTDGGPSGRADRERRRCHNMRGYERKLPEKGGLHKRRAPQRRHVCRGRCPLPNAKPTAPPQKGLEAELSHALTQGE